MRNKVRTCSHWRSKLSLGWLAGRGPSVPVSAFDRGVFTPVRGEAGGSPLSAPAAAGSRDSRRTSRSFCGSSMCPSFCWRAPGGVCVWSCCTVSLSVLTGASYRQSRLSDPYRVGRTRRRLHVHAGGRGRGSAAQALPLRESPSRRPRAVVLRRGEQFGSLVDALHGPGQAVPGGA